MATVTVSNQIGVPVHRVFQFFTDIEGATTHVSGIKKIEGTSFEREKTYTITHSKGGLRIDTVFWFEPAGDETKVTVEFEIDTAGLPPGLLAPLNWAIEGKVIDVIGHDLANLKTSLEQQQP